MNKKQRYCMILKIRPGKRNEYIELHKNVWPEVTDALKDANISNNSVFTVDELLINYMEYTGDNFLADWKKYGENQYVQKWFEKMRTLLIPYEDPMPPTAWTIVDEVFHLD